MCARCGLPPVGRMPEADYWRLMYVLTAQALRDSKKPAPVTPTPTEAIA